jgi:hypothetical protein
VRGTWFLVTWSAKKKSEYGDVLYQNCPTVLYGTLVYLDLPFLNIFRAFLGFQGQFSTPVVFLHFMGTGCGIRSIEKSRYHTCTRGTRTHNTAGIPVPVSHTIPETPRWEASRAFDHVPKREFPFLERGEGSSISLRKKLRGIVWISRIRSPLTCVDLCVGSGDRLPLAGTTLW